MATRRDAREWAVQLLFELDMNSGDFAERFDNFWQERETDSKTREFAEGLIRGVLDNRGRIDSAIRTYAANWDIHRMAVVDRNILRLALYEIMLRPDIPAVVSINEAVDLAKYFNSVESGRFVNGILDRVRRDLEAGCLEAEPEADEEQSEA